MKNRTIFHIDMNSFFASCEQAANPTLKDRPVIVCGDPDRRSGIVLAASYEAKKYGVKTTMLIHQAIKLCPNAIMIKTNHQMYTDMSNKIMTIFDDYTPVKEQVSIDEAFLDMTGTEHLFGQPEEAAQAIQQRILKDLDLSCSVGISTNKILAKMGSELKKPMGITTLYPDEVKEKLWPLQVGKLIGIGKKTAQRLNKLGIFTVGQLAVANEKILVRHFGIKSAKYMLDSSNGIGSDEVNPFREPVKSVGNEITYGNNLTSIDEICNELLLLADKVGYRLRKKILKGRTITIKLKYSNFKVITRSKTVGERTDCTNTIYKTAVNLLKENYRGEPLRLIGITVSNFDEDNAAQLSLFDNLETSIKSSKIDYLVDKIRNKHGYTSIKRATLINKSEIKK